MSNELGRLASGVGDIMKYGTKPFFVSIKFLQEERQHISMQYVIIEH